MATPPAITALGISRDGFFIVLAKVATTSKPIKLNRMIDRYVNELVSPRSGMKVLNDMSLAKPLLQANQMPTIPTTAVMSTLMTAPPSMTQSASATGCIAMTVTPHTKAISMAIRIPSENSIPHTALMTLGNMQAILATHSGKLTQ